MLILSNYKYKKLQAWRQFGLEPETSMNFGYHLDCLRVIFLNSEAAKKAFKTWMHKSYSLYNVQILHKLAFKFPN